MRPLLDRATRKALCDEAPVGVTWVPAGKTMVRGGMTMAGAETRLVYANGCKTCSVSRPASADAHRR